MSKHRPLQLLKLDKMTEMQDEYKNKLHAVVDSEEEDLKLKNDAGNLQITLQQNFPSLEKQVPKEPLSQGDETDAATWTKKSILFFLDCLTKRKQDLKSSKKKDIWKQIKYEMKNKGYKFDENSIERKFRNMKQTHKTIKDKIKSATGRGEVKWEYFEAMEAIFADDKTINIGHRISSFSSTSSLPPTSFLPSTSKISEPTSPLNLNLIKTEETSKETDILEESIPIPSQKIQTPTSSTLVGGASSKEKSQREEQLYGLRKQQLEVEQIKIKELQMLRAAIEENNKIQKERNELLKMFIEKQL